MQHSPETEYRPIDQEHSLVPSGFGIYSHSPAQALLITHGIQRGMEMILSSPDFHRLALYTSLPHGVIQDNLPRGKQLLLLPASVLTVIFHELHLGTIPEIEAHVLILKYIGRLYRPHFQKTAGTKHPFALQDEEALFDKELAASLEALKDQSTNTLGKPLIETDEIALIPPYVKICKRAGRKGRPPSSATESQSHEKLLQLIGRPDFKSVKVREKRDAKEIPLFFSILLAYNHKRITPEEAMTLAMRYIHKSVQNSSEVKINQSIATANQSRLINREETQFLLLYTEIVAKHAKQKSHSSKPIRSRTRLAITLTLGVVLAGGAIGTYFATRNQNSWNLGELDTSGEETTPPATQKNLTPTTPHPQTAPLTTPPPPSPRPATFPAIEIPISKISIPIKTKASRFSQTKAEIDIEQSKKLWLLLGYVTSTSIDPKTRQKFIILRNSHLTIKFAANSTVNPDQIEMEVPLQH